MFISAFPSKKMLPILKFFLLRSLDDDEELPAVKDHVHLINKLWH